MRWTPACLIIFALSSCSRPPRTIEQPQADLTAEAWYAPAAAQLITMARDAEAALKAGRNQDASKIVTDSQPLANRLLAASHPTLAAVEAASDLDDLYGRMLMADKRYGWARLQFQKNVTRWKYWQPRTPDTDRRLKQAQDAIAECDRNL
jgi:hypothetical protein